VSVYSSLDLERERIFALQCSALARVDKQEVMRRVAEGSSFVELFASLERRSGEALELPDVEPILEECRRCAIEILPLSFPGYPELLRATSSPPLALFVRSGSPLRNFPREAISIVGSRAACVEVCQTASQLAHDLAIVGCTVVSGLALGVDGAAHRGALAGGGECPTIAVMAHGLDTVYPRSHQFLARSIVERGGLIVSEYPPGIQPLKHHFLERNRIVAGLARGIVVVQAGERSGSLVTANYAADFGRDVFVLEGSREDSRYCGSDRLCEEGAILVQSAAQVLSEYGLRAPGPQGMWVTISLEELTSRTGGSMERALTWELEGRLVRLSGNRFSLREVSGE
jgi:DNA protecting protein DprA